MFPQTRTPADSVAQYFFPKVTSQGAALPSGDESAWNFIRFPLPSTLPEKRFRLVPPPRG